MNKIKYIISAYSKAQHKLMLKHLSTQDELELWLDEKIRRTSIGNGTDVLIRLNEDGTVQFDVAGDYVFRIDEVGHFSNSMKLKI